MLLRWLSLAILGLGVFTGMGGNPAAGRGDRSGPIAVAPDGSFIAVVNPDSNTVSLVANGTVREVAVGANPQTVSISTDGEIAWVVNRDDGTVSVVSTTEARQIGTAPVCPDAHGVVADELRIWVSCFSSGEIVALGLPGLERVATIVTEPDPRGLALWRGRLLVTHFSTGALSIVDPETHRVEAVIRTLADSNLSQSVFIDAERDLAYLPQTRSNSANEALLFDTTLFPIVSVVDLQTQTSVAGSRIALDIADRPTSIPIDAVMTAERHLYVVNAGSNDLSVIDLDTGFAVAHLDVGDNPRGLALSPDGSRIYVNNTLSGSVSVVDTEAIRVIETIVVTSIPLSPGILNGKRLFNSSVPPALARDRWISCASCHFDGGMDRRTWFFRDGPRNTPALFGVGETLPIHWSGDLDELQDVESAVRIIQAGTGLAEGDDHCLPACDLGPPNAGRSQDLDDLAAFMATLRIPQGRALSPQAVRGRGIFFSADTGCAGCHVGPLFTDRQRHDVGTATSPRERKGPRFDTPSLRGLVRTAPYLHDGSATTLLDVLTTANSGDDHGRTSHLAADQLEDLIAFLESIPAETTRTRIVRR